MSAMVVLKRLKQEDYESEIILMPQQDSLKNKRAKQNPMNIDVSSIIYS